MKNGDEFQKKLGEQGIQLLPEDQKSLSIGGSAFRQNQTAYFYENKNPRYANTSRNARGQFGFDSERDYGGIQEIKIGRLELDSEQEFGLIHGIKISQSPFARAEFKIGKKDHAFGSIHFLVEQTEAAGVAFKIKPASDEPLTQWDINRTLDDALRHADEFSPEITEKLRDLLKQINCSPEEVKLKSIAIDGPSISGGLVASGKGISIKAEAQVAAIRVEMQIPAGDITGILRLGVGWGISAGKNKSASGRTRMQETTQFSAGMWTIQFTAKGDESMRAIEQQEKIKIGQDRMNTQLAEKLFENAAVKREFTSLVSGLDIKERERCTEIVTRYSGGQKQRLDRIFQDEDNQKKLEGFDQYLKEIHQDLKSMKAKEVAREEKLKMLSQFQGVMDGCTMLAQLGQAFDNKVLQGVGVIGGAITQGVMGIMDLKMASGLSALSSISTIVGAGLSIFSFFSNKGNKGLSKALRQISEQIAAVHQDMIQGFNIVIENQRKTFELIQQGFNHLNLGIIQILNSNVEILKSVENIHADLIKLKIDLNLKDLIRLEGKVEIFTRDKNNKTSSFKILTYLKEQLEYSSTTFCKGVSIVNFSLPAWYSLESFLPIKSETENSFYISGCKKSSLPNLLWFSRVFSLYFKLVGHLDSKDSESNKLRKNLESEMTSMLENVKSFIKYLGSDIFIDHFHRVNKGRADAEDQFKLWMSLLGIHDYKSENSLSLQSKDLAPAVELLLEHLEIAENMLQLSKAYLRNPMEVESHPGLTQNNQKPTIIFDHSVDSSDLDDKQKVGIFRESPKTDFLNNKQSKEKQMVTETNSLTQQHKPQEKPVLSTRFDLDKISESIDMAVLKKVEQLVDRQTWIILGPTQQGKSTLINHLMGCEYKEKIQGRTRLAEKVSGTEVAEVGNGKHSKTSSPQLYFPENEPFVYCDMPGFGDTRGSLAAMFQRIEMELLANASKTIKVAVVLGYDDLVGTGDKLRSAALDLGKIFGENYTFIRDHAVFFVTQSGELAKDPKHVENIREAIRDHYEQLSGQSDLLENDKIKMNVLREVGSSNIVIADVLAENGCRDVFKAAMGSSVLKTVTKDDLKFVEDGSVMKKLKKDLIGAANHFQTQFNQLNSMKSRVPALSRNLRQNKSKIESAKKALNKETIRENRSEMQEIHLKIRDNEQMIQSLPKQIADDKSALSAVNDELKRLEEKLLIWSQTKIFNFSKNLTYTQFERGRGDLPHFHNVTEEGRRLKFLGLTRRTGIFLRPNDAEEFSQRFSTDYEVSISDVAPGIFLNCTYKRYSQVYNPESKKYDVTVYFNIHNFRDHAIPLPAECSGRVDYLISNAAKNKMQAEIDDLKSKAKILSDNISQKTDDLHEYRVKSVKLEHKLESMSKENERLEAQADEVSNKTIPALISQGEGIEAELEYSLGQIKSIESELYSESNKRLLLTIKKIGSVLWNKEMKVFCDDVTGFYSRDEHFNFADIEQALIENESMTIDTSDVKHPISTVASNQFMLFQPGTQTSENQVNQVAPAGINQASFDRERANQGALEQGLKNSESTVPLIELAERKVTEDINQERLETGVENSLSQVRFG